MSEFNIPVTETILKFCEKEFFAGMKPPYKIEEGSVIGSHIFKLLTDKRKPPELITDIDRQYDLPIILSSTLSKRSPSHEKLYPLGNYLEDQYRICLRHWCQALQAAGSTRTNAVKKFLSFYQISEQRNFDAAYQYATRVDQYEFSRIQKANKSRKSSAELHCPESDINTSPGGPQ